VKTFNYQKPDDAGAGSRRRNVLRKSAKSSPVTAGVLLSFMSAVVMFEMGEKPARRWIRKVFVGAK